MATNATPAPLTPVTAEKDKDPLAQAMSMLNSPGDGGSDSQDFEDFDIDSNKESNACSFFCLRVHHYIQNEHIAATLLPMDRP